ncbi:hypothetical protein A5686_14895 [Mycobacterium sp. E2479]|nr:hypothetical protein A5686_14895 [Mycobacterium sp. E2479]
MLGLHSGSVVSADTLVELLWGDDPPRTAAKALPTHISSLRRTLGDGFVLTEGAGWTLAESEVDASLYTSAARLGREAAAAGDTSQAVTRFEEALALWRGIPELPDGRRGTSEKTRWIEGHAALVEDRAEALLATGRAAEVIGDLEAAVADAPLRERRWGQLMLALYRAGRQGEALAAYQRARSLLAAELGVDPGPNLRRLEAAIVAQDASLDIAVAQQASSVTRAVTFVLTDIEGSTAAWEADADAMAVALARHDELIEQVVTSQGGRLIKTRGEGDATFSVFERPSAAAAAAIELQEAIAQEPWSLREPLRIRMALHTGEVELRDGDYFGRAVNRAARLRSLAVGGQILCSGATAELVIDSLRDDAVLTDLGMRELRNLVRPEHVFELRFQTADDHRHAVTTDAPLKRPSLPAVLAGPGPFVGREHEFARLFAAWQTSLAGATNAVLIAGEPGVGKTRLAGEWSRQAYDQGALVIYGRCDEDLGAPYQPFAEALRALVPCLGSSRLRGMRGAEALLPLVPGLTDLLPDLAAPARADPDTERYALFDAVVALLGLASGSAPVVLVLDDLHWAAKPTLLLLRHLLRFGEHARVQILGTYRSTDLDRAHPLAATLADLHRDRTADRIALSGLDEEDVTAYVVEAGYDDEELARALASVTGGNPFFLIEALRHVDESGGHWDPGTLPQGVREAVSRRLTRLPAETNKALAAAAVVGSRFGLELVERVVEADLVDAFDEACKAGIVIEESSGHYRFNHAIVRQSLLAELPSVRRLRLHQRIATTLENEPGADDELLAELAHHYFECAWAGNAAKAVEYCRRAADQAMTRLAYEGAADLYDRARHALEEIDDELPDRDDQVAAVLIARCEALLAAGDVTSAAGAVAQLQEATRDSARLAAWATCFDGQLSMLVHPERLDEIEPAVGAAARKLAELDDAAGEAMAHTVRAACLARLGRIGDCEIALDDALTAARRAREHRRVNAVLANAPLAALWGPNPVPRAGGRCLDVVRLLRITTDSPAVEATSTRCQAMLEAFRGRAAAARRMIDSARRTVTELGLRHAVLEVQQFAGIVELVVGDPAAAEPHLRQAYNGFRRMGLDADTAETAALLGRACLALDRGDEADELCTESERLAGHALKASIAWRTLRARLLSRSNDHDEARRVAEAAVSVAEHTDALVDHGDACLTLATVLGAAGNVAGARAAAEQAADLYERKGAATLVERARLVLGKPIPTAPAAPEPPAVELHTAAVQASERVTAAVDHEDWDEFERLFAPDGTIESRRKIVGFTPTDFRSGDVIRQTRRDLEAGIMRARHVVIAVRGERLALARLTLGTLDVTAGAPQDELLQLYGIDNKGRIAWQVWFDVDDIDAAMAELDAAHALKEEHPRPRLQNTASRANECFLANFAVRDWDALTENFAAELYGDDRRAVVGVGIQRGRDAMMRHFRTAPGLEVTQTASDTIATRGDRLVLARNQFSRFDDKPDAFRVDLLQIVETDADERISAIFAFDTNDFDAAIAVLDARYLAGEAAACSQTWSLFVDSYAAVNRHELPPTAPDLVSVDHRGVAPFTPGDMTPYIRATWDVAPDIKIFIEAVHRLSNLGAVVTHKGRGITKEGFEAEWHEIAVGTVEGGQFNRSELFDEADLDAALARFEELSRPAPRLENTATRVFERLYSYVAAGDWHAVAQISAEDVCVDDRRRVVNAGILHGRDANIKDAQATAAVGFTMTMLDVLATRGERLALTGVRVSGRDPEAIQNDALQIVEINAEERIAGVVVFELDDFDSAVAELDARYLAGDAVAHSDAWSVIAGAYAGLNRHELPPTTSSLVDIDHRGESAFGYADLAAYARAGRDFGQFRIYIEAVHRLNNSGAMFTYVAHERSQEGFDAEWRGANILLVEGNLIGHSEVFDAADIDAAIARFEELHPQVHRLENSASQVAERYSSHFASRDWDALGEVLAVDFILEDRRRAVNAGVRHGRDGEIANLRAMVEAGFTHMASVVVAVRGQRLVLTRSSGRTTASDEFQSDALGVVEINSDNRIAAIVVFDADNFDAAIAELDARYIAGEAAAHAHTWSAIVENYSAINRHELPAMTADCVSIDHRRAAGFAPGEVIAYARASLDDEHNIRNYVEAVHRLNDLGVVFTHVRHEIAQEGFDAEWRIVFICMVESELVSRCELFDEADLDTAITKFEVLLPQAHRPENAASQIGERYLAHIAAGDWDAMAELLADDIVMDDRRRMVGAGIRHGRDALIVDMRAIANLSVMNVDSRVIAVRGERLVILRSRFTNRDPGSEALLSEVLVIVETNADYRIVTAIAFGLDDFDAAIAELDARYLAGDAAAHARTWSVIAENYAALNRHELPPMAPDCVSIDHRRGAAFPAGEVIDYARAGLDHNHSIRNHVEAVHLLDDLGVVFTHVGHETSQEGFDAEWRIVFICTVEDDLVSRCELFDEADLDTAIARFEQLSRPTPRLENAASKVHERSNACFMARDWAALAETFADGITTQDRRRVIGHAVGHGRDAVVANGRAIIDFGMTKVTSTVIAIRGNRLVLARARYSGPDEEPGAFHTDVLNVVESNADNRVAMLFIFDPDDIDGALEELDARYASGEAADFAHAWSLVTGAYAAIKRHELAPTTPDFVNIDHRRGAAYAPGDLISYIRAGWELGQDISTHIEAVHRLNNFGAVVTHSAHGTTQDGFDAEWRGVQILAVEGDMISRSEIFDEADLKTAIARFDQLSRPAPRLKNAVKERFLKHFEARNWDALAEDFAEDYYNDDRRRVVNSGVRHGRDIAIEDLRTGVDIGLLTRIAVDIIATRGERLILMRVHNSGHNHDAVELDMLQVVEYDADERIAAAVVFDPDDFAAAFTELDARYLGGEAAAHAHTWSVISGVHAAFNQRELPTTPTELLDHRPLVTVEAGDPTASIRGMWDFTPDLNIYIEAVHRLSNLGAVFTQVSHGTSKEGFAAEWRIVELVTVSGDLIKRGELFDEADLDTTLARFDELHSQAPRLENTTSRLIERIQTCFAARDWEVLAELIAEDFSTDDRRRVVSAGVRHGRDAEIENNRAIADLGITKITTAVIATRGERLLLTRTRYSSRDEGRDAFLTELLSVVEINEHERIAAVVAFDLDDVDAAFAELDARYLAGEGAAHAHTWSVIVAACAAFNCREIDYATTDSVYIDHRRLDGLDAGGIDALASATWDVTQNVRTRIEAVHRLSELGVVLTIAMTGTSPEGFDAEWRTISVFMIDGNRLSRCEIFDEADLDAALARFDELHPPARQLANAASRAEERFFAYFGTRDWAAMAEILTDDSSIDNRSRVVNSGFWNGREAIIANQRALADVVAAENITLTVIATRGERLVLTRMHSPGSDPRNGEFVSEMLIIAEIDTNGRISAHIGFDLDNLEAAFAELDARYVAAEAAPYAHTWSLIDQTHAMLNRHEIPPTAAGFVNIDHRRGIAFAPGDIVPFVRATFDDTPDVRHHIVAVHRLSGLGAVITQALHGTSRQGLDAEWQNIALFIFEGDLATRVEIFDEEDLDAAIVRFNELQSPVQQLENAASQAGERFLTRYESRDWDAMAELLADDSFRDDRRPVVGAGVQHGRDAQIADMRAITELWIITNLKLAVIATRGERLALTRTSFSGRDQGSEPFLTEVLNIAEINSDGRFLANISFDLDDIDAAFAELDARYLAGEAAGHAETWSVITRWFAAVNKHDIPPTTPDWVAVDHRRLPAFEGGDLPTALRAVWDVTPDLTIHIERVHRLSSFGVVAAFIMHGTSPEGLAVEWRTTEILTVEGDLIKDLEIFDEADLDAALARFEELQPQAPRPKNAASQVEQRCVSYFAARDWDSITELLADDILMDDRRRVVNVGTRRGRDAQIADMRAIADVGVTDITPTVIAVRGERLVLASYFGLDSWSGHKELGVSEINSENQIVARVQFNADDIDAAFEELDARYIAGEAAVHAHTWSVIAGAHAAINRHELPATTPDWVNIDHRRGIPVASGDVTAYLRASLNAPAGSICIEAVHRLSHLGAVVTWEGRGTSEEGFDAEWRGINVLAVEGDLISRCELFDETDLDAALARFDELQPAARQLENAASRVDRRFLACVGARDWDAMAEIAADDYYVDDRRRAVNIGLLQGRAAAIASARTVAELGLTITMSDVIATRGERLVLSRARWQWSGSDQRAESFHSEVLNLVEINDRGRMTARVWFETNDFDAAFEELDARYLASEAALYARVWTAIATAYAAFNRHEMPATASGSVYIDHRPLVMVEAADLADFTRATWDMTPDVTIYIEMVHSLSDLGAVVTSTARGTSHDAFDAEWRMIHLFTVEGHVINRSEMFDEADLEAALGRFDELHPKPQLENTASRVGERFLAHFHARDWDSMAEMLADDFAQDDRRRIVGAGVRHGRDAQIADLRVVADLRATYISSTAVATRGERLVLTRQRLSFREEEQEGFLTDVLVMFEINADERIAVSVSFSPDDIDAAFAELDSRYLAGEAAAYSKFWSVIANGYATLNNHELPPVTSKWVTIDHRMRATFQAADQTAYIRGAWALTPNLKMYIEAVHRLSDHAAVVTHAAYGSTQEGFAAEWRMIELLAAEDDNVSRCELFDEADLDVAIASFEELQPQPPRLENMASQVVVRFMGEFARSEWDAMAGTMADDFSNDDRRRVVGSGIRYGRDAEIADMRAIADLSLTNVTSTPLATRGDGLCLVRLRFSGRREGPEAYIIEFLSVVEIDADERVVGVVSFDLDNIDAAFEELDARYLAGEAAAHARTWSVNSRLYAAFNRHELPATAPDWVYIDHRPLVTIEAPDWPASLRAFWDIAADFRSYVEAVHRLSDLGAVITAAVYGTSHEGFHAEWRVIDLFTIDGDLVNRCEIFNEDDLDAALARFDELDRPTPAE